MVERISCDICVIGRSRAGLSVAKSAAFLMKNVVLIAPQELERPDPSQSASTALLAFASSAQSAHNGRKLARFGIHPPKILIDPGGLKSHITDVQREIGLDDSCARLESLGVRVLNENVHFKTPKLLVNDSETKEFSARHFVIATGEKARTPPADGLDQVTFFTEETIFDLSNLPEKLAIIGDDERALRLAQAYGRLESKVRLLAPRRLLDGFDRDLLAPVLDELRCEGVQIYENCIIEHIEPARGLGAWGCRVIIGPSAQDDVDREDKKIEVTHLLVCSECSPAIDGLGLENAKVEHDEKGIKTHPGMRTSRSNIYAVGPVINAPYKRYGEEYHARLAIRSMLDYQHDRLDENCITRLVLTEPEIAQTGLDEDEARAICKTVRVLRWSYRECERAIAEDQAEGFIKIIVDGAGFVRGASIVGARAGEIITPWSLAIKHKVKLSALADFVVPHQAYGEIEHLLTLVQYIDLPDRSFLQRLLSFFSLSR